MVTESAQLDLLRWIVGAPLLSAVLLGTLLVVRRQELPRRVVAALSAVSAAVAFAFSCAAFIVAQKAEGGAIPVDVVYTWLGAGIGNAAFSADLALQFDRLSALLCLFVTGVGLTLVVYSSGFMAADQRQDAGFQRYFCYLNFGLGSMLLLVLADNLLVLFVGWQGVSLSTSLLINFWYAESRTARAAGEAIIVNRIGDVGLLLSILVLYWTLSDAGVPSVSFRAIEANLPLLSALSLSVPDFMGGEWPLLTFVGSCLLLAVCARSAQLPLHAWLTRSEGSPVPISALVQSVAGVAAGVYLVCRFAFLFSEAPGVPMVMAWVGGGTAIFGAACAAVQRDIGRLLAFSTMSQIGFVLMAAGCGAYVAAVFHLLTHAFVKPALFMGAGAVILALDGERDLQKMGGLRSGLRWTHVSMIAVVLAASGFPSPLTFGFFSRDQILQGVYLADAIPGHLALYGVALVTVAVTSFYLFRLLFLVFWGTARAVPNFRSRVDDPRRLLLFPLIGFALLACCAGLLSPPQFWGDILIPGEESSDSLANHLAPLLGTGGLSKLGTAEQWWLIARGFLACLVGLGWALLLYVVRPGLPERITKAMPRFHAAFAEGLYFDRIQDWIVVRPLKGTADRVLYRGIDRGFLDEGVVLGVARLFAGLPEYALKYLQSGQPQSYLVVLIAGALALSFWLLG